MPDKEKKPFFRKLLDRVKPAKPDRPELPRLFGQEPRRQADYATPGKDRPEAKPERPIIEKEPTRPHIGVTTRLTSQWWQTGTVRPGNFEYGAMVYFEPSSHGIDKSEVSKLSVRDAQGREVAHYDRGWDLEPEPGSAAAKAVRQIVAFYRDNARDMPYQDWPLEDAKSEAITSPEQARNPMGFFQKDGHEPIKPLTEAEQAAIKKATEKGDSEAIRPTSGADVPALKANRSDLGKVRLVDPASFKKQPAISQTEPAKEAQARPYNLEIDAATTIGRNRHEAGGAVYSLRTDDRFHVELEWHEIHGQGADGKPTLLSLHVRGFQDDEPIIHYDGDWIVQPATDEAMDILAVIEERYGRIAEKARESSKPATLSSEERTVRIQAERDAREAEESRDLGDEGNER